MTVLLSIDPGTHSGWAVFENRVLTGVGLLTKNTSIFIPGIMGIIHRFEVDDILIEVPQIYRQEKWKGDPNDLIILATLCGEVNCIGFLRGINTKTVRPRDWKGTRPKKVDNDYTLKLLSSKEKTLYEQQIQKVPRSHRHNAIDAIGIGLWKLRRR